VVHGFLTRACSGAGARLVGIPLLPDPNSMCHVPCHFILFPYSFSFILIHFRSSFHSFLFSVRSPVSDSYVLVLVPSGLSSYVSVLVHVMRPSSRPLRMPFVRDRYVVASLFRICTPSRLHFRVFPVALLDSLFRQLYSLLVPPVWDQSERAPFFQSLVPLFPSTSLHPEFAPSSSLLLPGCCSSL